MKDPQAKDIRNFAVVGHGSSGKTTLAEAMLATTGAINRMGTIGNGNTASDYHPYEKEHQISMHSTLLRTDWHNTQLNIIDAPGYADFVGDAMGALRVADFALIVVHAGEGIGVGTERMWRQAGKLGIPKILGINGFNRPNSSWETVLEQLRKAFGETVFPMTIPLREGADCHACLDVLRRNQTTYKEDQSGQFQESAAEGPEGEGLAQRHQQLVEYVAEADDSLLERFFDQGGLSEEELRGSLHTAFQNQTFVPLFCTAADANVGVTRLLDFIAKFGSSPVDRKTVPALSDSGEEVDISLEGSDPVVFVYKTLAEEHIGELSFFRIYSGTLTVGQALHNSVHNESEKVGQILLLNGKDREIVDHLRAGNLGAMVKLKNTHTNDSLCSPQAIIRLPETEYPIPNIHAALKTTSKGDEEKIAEGLALIHEEDPTFLFRVDPELRQTILSGQGELHMNSVCETLKRRYAVSIELGKPKVPYRETIRGRGESRYRYKKQTGGAGQFAEVWLRIQPGERNSGVEFGHSLVGNNVDRGYVPSVEKGVRAAENDGILAGCRIVDVQVDFFDGKQHPVDSKDIAFQVAGKQAFREAFLKASPHLLEPVLDVQIRVQEDAMGHVLGDLSSRRGKVLGMDTAGGFQIINAQIPQREMHAYSTALRSLTGGRGEHTEKFSHYEDIPREIEQQVISEYKEENKVA